MDGTAPSDEWYRSVRPSLLAALTVALADPHLAAEVLDEAIVRALDRWDRVSQLERPEGWIYTTAIRLAQRTWWRRRRADELLQQQRPSGGDDVGLTAEVWDAVQRLPVQQRRTVAARYLLGFDQAETARLLGVRPGTVASNLSDARRALASALSEEDDRV